MKIQATRTVDLAADALRAQILAGEHAPGDRLPAERELSAALGISRLTLRAALARLQAEGLVQPRQGLGVEVLDWRARAGLELLPVLVEGGDLSLLGPFLELRRAVAAEAVALACTRATKAELDELERLAQRLATGTDHAELVTGNLAFAAMIVHLAGNLPMTLLFNTVARVFEVRPDVAEALVVQDSAVRGSFPAVVALLRQRDPDHAREAVRQALKANDDATLRALEAR